MRTLAAVLSFCLLGSCQIQEEPEAKKVLSHKEAEYQIDLIMEMMDWPETALLQMDRNDMQLHPDFSLMTNKIYSEAEKLTKLVHPEVKFNKMALENLKKLKELQVVIKSQDAQQIHGKGLEVKQSCKDCHDIYN